MMSIVATETSVLTFISVPGIAYRGDWTFLKLSFGYLFGRMIVSYFILPLYFDKSIISIYEILGSKFGQTIQRFSSLIFIITRLLADGVRFFATALVVQFITGWSMEGIIIIIGLVTLVYTILGGIRTVINIDSFQFVLYIACALISIIYIVADMGVYDTSKSLLESFENGKLNIFSSQFDLTNPYNFINAFIGGMFLSLASHGVDFMMVQRVLSTNDEKWNTIPRTFAEIDTLREKFRKKNDQEKLILLEDINSYIEEIEKSYQKAS